MNPQSSATESKPRKQLTRDQRIEVRALRRYGLTIKQISLELGFTMRQVQYTCERNDENPKPRPGRRPRLSPEQVDELENYIRSSPNARHMSYLELAVNPFSHWNCGENAIRTALSRRGYRRCLVRARPQAGERAGPLQWETRKKSNRERVREPTGNDIERDDGDRPEDSVSNEEEMILSGYEIIKDDGENNGVGREIFSDEEGDEDGDKRRESNSNEVGRENDDQIIESIRNEQVS